MSNLGVCIGNLVYYLAVQPRDDMAYKLSDLVKVIILYKPEGFNDWEGAGIRRFRPRGGH